MELNEGARLLRVFIGEAHKIHHDPLYEVIVREARAAGLAGATVWRGLMSFGSSSRVRTAKAMDLSSDLPLVIEIVDQESKLNGFKSKLDELFEAAGCGGLVTIEPVEVIRYTHGKNTTGSSV